jgi:polysaccharide deacetylase 2 family uncharacterized protein YibQ
MLLTVRLAFMPRRKNSSSPLPALGWIALSALALFALGEAYRYSRSDSGQLALARRLGLGSREQVTRLVGKRLEVALTRAGARTDSISERVLTGSGPTLSWRVTLPPDASLLQFNSAVTRSLESDGLAVLSGRETWTERGAPMLRLLIGLPKRATHELLVVRSQRGEGQVEPEPARLALVLFGFGEDAAKADSFFAAPFPFAVAVAAGDKGSAASFRAAHKRGRELVLHLPLEPLNFPQVNPGPGTLLVTMKPTKVAGEVRRYLDQAAPVAAVANDLGSLATQDMTLMRAVYRELKKGDVPFLHVSPVAGAVCKPLAADMGIAYAEPDIVVDHEARTDTRALDRAWTAALKHARARGRVVVWMRATPLSIRWLPGALASKRIEGVSIVPLSALLRQPTAP